MIRIKKTKRRKIPYPYILGKQFRPFNIEYNKRILAFNKLVDKYSEEYVILKDGWILNNESAELMLREYPEWRYYLPPFSLKDKVVLDIGADCGSTARYYLLNGAERVICIENNEECIKYLEINSRNRNIFVIPHDFDYRMLLDIDYDFCKIDIEGYETLIINAYEKGEFALYELKPIVIEAHSQYCINKLKEMYFKVIYDYRSDLKLLANW
jgi:hypothetical protein